MTVDLEKVLDLTDESTQDALETTLMELTGDWRAAYRAWEKNGRTRVVTQELGRAAFEGKWEAVKYPSAYNAERWNLVVFSENTRIAVQANLPDPVLQAMMHLNSLPQ